MPDCDLATAHTQDLPKLDRWQFTQEAARSDTAKQPPQQQQQQPSAARRPGQPQWPLHRPDRVYTVPVMILTVGAGQAKTTLARSMLASNSAWILLPEAAAPEAAAPEAAAPTMTPSTPTTSTPTTSTKPAVPSFTPYLTTARLHRDLLWNNALGLFYSVVAFSTFCQGPPGWVHGGCMFAVLGKFSTHFSRFREGAISWGGVPPLTQYTASNALFVVSSVSLADWCLIY